MQRLAGLDQAETFRRVDAERLEHFRRQHFAHAAFERQPPVAKPRIGRLPRTFCPEIEQAVLIVAQLRKEKSATVANLRIVAAELMAVIAERQWLLEIAGQGIESGEVTEPLPIAQAGEPDPRRPALIAVAEYPLRKIGGLYAIIEGGAIVAPESFKNRGRVIIFHCQYGPC